MNKKLIYIANIRLPTEKAHGIQIMEMCSAFSDQGLKVKLLVPRRFNSIKDDPFKYHDVKKNFSISRLLCIDLVRFGRIGFLIQLVTFAEAVAWYAFFTRGAIFYTRDELLALYLKFLGKKVVWEGHTGQKNIIVKVLIRIGTKFVVITDALKGLYLSMGENKNKILVAPDGADIDRFDIDLSKSDARRELGLPQDKKIVLYKGHLYEWKGAHTMARSARYLDKNILCMFIGGTEADVASFKSQFGDISNVLILGNKPRKETPVYQKAADILVIPNSAKEDVSKLYTSPMKMFGYMAGGVPIVASDLPSLREVLNEKTSYFFEPDNPLSLANEIKNIFSNYPQAVDRAAEALEEVRKYSWSNRAKKIIEFINNV